MWRVHTAAVLDALATITSAIMDQETGVRGYLISGDEKFLEPYRKGRDDFTGVMKKLKDLTLSDPAEQGRVDELNELVSEWRSEIADREIALTAKPETREDARAFAVLGAGETRMDFIRAKIDAIDRGARERLAKNAAAQFRAYGVAYMVIVVGASASLIVAVLIGLVLTRNITNPVTRMTSTMAALADGDTSMEVPEVSRKDELGTMAKAVVSFRDSIVERQRAQAALERANRIATMGQLTASISHEAGQPITAMLTGANAALRWLTAQPPNLEEAQRALHYVISDGKRVGDVFKGLRALIKKVPPQRSRLNFNEIILETIALARSQVIKHGVLVADATSTKLAAR